MSPPSVLIVAERHDQMAPRLASALEARDCSVRTLDASTYPDALTMTFAKHAHAPHGNFYLHSQSDFTKFGNLPPDSRGFAPYE